MKLKSITYSQFEGRPEEWHIKKILFGNINLIVGKNATGKSRTLNIIKGLGNLVSGDIVLAFMSGNYKAIFDKDGEELTYILKYDYGEVEKEKLIIGSEVKLDRKSGGKGKIYAVKMNDFMKFQAPTNQIACVIRRDEVQHPFFEDLYTWGKNLRHYYFGTQLGKDHFAVFKKGREEQEINLKDTNITVAILKKGMKKYNDKYITNIKKDMEQIGYKLKDISVENIKTLTFHGTTEQPHGISVKESDLKGKTDQNEMSQGMFRCLSLIIQLNYSLLIGTPSCILIDDIGEGLDYERSSALIKLLIYKAKNSCVQLIMSTNDRFIMNNVPLEYWSVMKRFPNESKIYNYNNSKKRFKDFELTGLNNFDFFTSGAFGGGEK